MMKQLEMSNFGVLEMEHDEMTSIDGGVIHWLVAAVVGNFVYQLVGDWEKNVASFKEGQAAYKSSGHGATGSY
jgi:hypothetical protein